MVRLHRSPNDCRPTLEVLESRLTPSVSFAAQQTLTVGTKPLAAAVGDFNGDGRPDLVLANSGNVTGTTVSVLLDTAAIGATTPSFTAQQTFTVGTSPQAVVVADFNGDGRPDIAVVNTVSNTVSVLINTTSPGATAVSFAAQQTFAVGNGPEGIAVGDFNGDGLPDLAVANTGSNTVSVLLNLTPPGAAGVAFANQQTFAVGSKPFAVAAADFNGDGRADLVTANSNDGTASVLLNTAAAGATTASFAAQQTFAVGTTAKAVAVGDFNGDGRPDFAVANAGSNSVSVLLNTTAAGATTAAFAAQQTFAVGSDAYALAAADLDGDGRPDLAVVNLNDMTVSVLANTTTTGGAASASFAAQQTFAVGSGPSAVTAADLNGDGRPDLLIANYNDNTVSALLNTATPFTSTVPVVVGLFGGGVNEFNRATRVWNLLTAANASLAAADAQGDVVGEFPGNGVWEYKPAAGWKQLNGIDATLLAVDPNGDVVAEFPGFGVGEYLPSAGWRLLTGANASLLAVDANGDVAGEFSGAGVWLFKPASGWKMINGVDATLLTMDGAGDVLANFKGVGVGEYEPSAGWQVLNGNQALALTAGANGAVAAVFQGYGTAVYSRITGWRTLAPQNAVALAFDALGNLLAELPGNGVWEYDVYHGWSLLTSGDASLLVVA